MTNNILIDPIHQQISSKNSLFNNDLSFCDKLRGFKEKYNILISVIVTLVSVILFGFVLSFLGISPVLSMYAIKLGIAGLIVNFFWIIINAIMQKIRMRKSGNNDLHEAIAFKCYYWMKCALKNRKIDVNKKNRLGASPLHLAVLSEDILATKLLLTNATVKKYINDRSLGILSNSSIKKESYENALEFAIGKENMKIVRILIENGADAEIRDCYGFSAFQYGLMMIRNILRPNRINNLQTTN